MTKDAIALREEFEMYQCIWRRAVREEGADSSVARLAQAFVEEVEEELEALGVSEKPRLFPLVH